MMKEPESINQAVIKRHGQYFVNLNCGCQDSCWRCDGTGMIQSVVSDEHAKYLQEKRTHKLYSL